jgi:hypothetical protein
LFTREGNTKCKRGTACRAPTTENATALVDETKTTWDELEEDVGVEHDDYADVGAEVERDDTHFQSGLPLVGAESFSFSNFANCSRT